MQRSKLGRKGGSAKREAKLEESVKHLQHKQGKADGERGRHGSALRRGREGQQESRRKAGGPVCTPC